MTFADWLRASDPDRPDSPAAAEIRATVADAIEAGTASPDLLIASFRAAFDKDQPRVPAGSGDHSGEWTSGPRSILDLPPEHPAPPTTPTATGRPWPALNDAVRERIARDWKSDTVRIEPATSPYGVKGWYVSEPTEATGLFYRMRRDGKVQSIGYREPRERFRFEEVTQVGITSSRPGKSNSDTFKQMRAFEAQLQAIPTVTDAKVVPGLGAWEGGEEPTWVVRYTGNGAAKRLIAETAKGYDQDSVLIMKPCHGSGCDPVGELTFEKPVSGAAMHRIAPILTAAGLGGWTWAKRGGKTVLRSVSVPAWGGEATRHLATMRRISEDLQRAGFGHTLSTSAVKTEVLDRTSYDTVAAGA